MASLGGIVLGASMMPTSVLAMVLYTQPRILSFYNVNTNERLSGEFSATTGFTRSLLGKLDYFMRDRRTDQSASYGSQSLHEVLSFTK